MMRIMWSGLLAVVLAVPTFAADPTPRAVLIGVGQFDDQQILPRPTAEADAKAVYDLLTDPKYLGLDRKNVRLLLGGEDAERGAIRATRENIVKALSDVVEASEPLDPVIVLLVGQGASAGETAVFFAADTEFKERSKTGLKPGDIEEIFKKFKSEQLLAAIDVHYKGGFKADEGEVVLEPNVLNLVSGFMGHDPEDENFEPTGRAVILGNSGLVSTITEEHGIFTKVMIDGLKGAADTEGYEPDGNVTVGELISYVEENVPPLARLHGENEEQKEQLPFVEFARSSHFVITHNPEVYPRVRREVEALKRIDLPEEAAEQGERLLERMPDLKTKQDLRKKYQSLVRGELSKEEFLAKRKEFLDGLKLGEAEARTYARKVYTGIESVARVFIKEIDKGEAVGHAIDGMFRRVRVPMPDELAKKVSEAKGMERESSIDLLVEARLFLGKREDLDGDKAADLSLRSMMTKLNDPYTTYIDRQQRQELEAPLTGQFTGIGIQIRRDLVRDGLLVVTPIKDSPAYKAGIKAGDLITTIIRPVDNDGKPLIPPETITTKGMKVSDAVRKILGQRGTPVKITVEREGVSEPITFELKRDRVEVESVLGWERETSDDSWDFMMDRENKIGYIRLTQFARNSYPEMRKAVEALKDQGMKGLILDVRNNPGGYLDTAVDICDMFIDDGLIVTIKPRVGIERPFVGEQQGSELDFPMAVLVNGGSASGSEIVAACLKDHDRAVVIGERSYGKGSVQNIQDFGATGGEIKLTTATFWRPNGKNLNKASTDGKDEDEWGVSPSEGFLMKLPREEAFELNEKLRDHEIIGQAPAARDTRKDFKDRQLESAKDYLKSQIKLSAKN